MIYLDYAANTPVCDEVLDTYLQAAKAYSANPNASHAAGRLAKAFLEDCTRRVADCMGAAPGEVIYTSGASEANNLALKGAAHYYKNKGKHIITTLLEHSSVLGATAALQAQGFEVDYVDITPDGQVDLDHLQGLLREDTILVSVCAVDSEVGLCQQLDALAAAVAKAPNCLLHVDATQAVGKIPVSSAPHLLTFAPHKFFGPGSCGVLIKKEGVQLEQQIHGGISTTPYRSGSPDLPMIAAAATALELALAHRQERYNQVAALNQQLRKGLGSYKQLQINSPSSSVPHILSISLLGCRSEQMQALLGEQGICVATRSACCAPNTVSRPVYALTKSKKAALSPLRISLSHLTTAQEIETFLDRFDHCYHQLVK